MNLYRVQDGDRPMWVLAGSYNEAVYRWRQQIAAENKDNDPDDDAEPEGVEKVAEGDNLDSFPEILWPGQKRR